MSIHDKGQFLDWLGIGEALNWAFGLGGDTYDAANVTPEMQDFIDASSEAADIEYAGKLAQWEAHTAGTELEHERLYSAARATAEGLAITQRKDAMRSASNLRLEAQDFATKSREKQADQVYEYSTGSGVLVRSGSAMARLGMTRAKGAEGVRRLEAQAEYALRRGELQAMMTVESIVEPALVLPAKPHRAVVWGETAERRAQGGGEAIPASASSGQPASVASTATAEGTTEGTTTTTTAPTPTTTTTTTTTPTTTTTTPTTSTATTIPTTSWGGNVDTGDPYGTGFDELNVSERWSLVGQSFDSADAGVSDQSLQGAQEPTGLLADIARGLGDLASGVWERVEPYVRSRGLGVLGAAGDVVEGVAEGRNFWDVLKEAGENLISGLDDRIRSLGFGIGGEIIDWIGGADPDEDIRLLSQLFGVEPGADQAAANTNQGLGLVPQLPDTVVASTDIRQGAREEGAEAVEGQPSGTPDANQLAEESGLIDQSLTGTTLGGEVLSDASVQAGFKSDAQDIRDQDTNDRDVLINAGSFVDQSLQEAMEFAMFSGAYTTASVQAAGRPDVGTLGSADEEEAKKFALVDMGYGSAETGAANYLGQPVMGGSMLDDPYSWYQVSPGAEPSAPGYAVAGVPGQMPRDTGVNLSPADLIKPPTIVEDPPKDTDPLGTVSTTTRAVEVRKFEYDPGGGDTTDPPSVTSPVTTGPTAAERRAARRAAEAERIRLQKIKDAEEAARRAKEKDLYSTPAPDPYNDNPWDPEGDDSWI